VTAEEMTAAVDRIVKLAHALTQLKEQLARCEGVTAHTRAALASAQAAHRRAEDDEEAARAALVAALGAAPDAAPPPADVPPVLSPERAASPAPHPVDERDGKPEHEVPARADRPDAPAPGDADVFTALFDRITHADTEAAIMDIRNEVVAEHKAGTLDEREARDLLATCETNAADLRAEADAAIDPAASATLRATLKSGLAAAMDVHSLGQAHTYRVLTSFAQLTPADRAELKAFYEARRDALAAAEKPAKKPRAPRPSERWTVREYAANGAPVETYQGGKVDAERHYRAREKELAPGERAELVSPKGVVLVHCTGKVRPWRVEARRAGSEAWEDLGPAEDALDAREAYDLALRGSAPGDHVRLLQPDGVVAREETVVAADAGGALESRVVEPAATEPAASDDDARCDELLRTRTRHPHVVLALPGGGGAGPDWGVVFEGATLGSAIKAQRAAVKRLRGTGGRVRRYENAALVEHVPVAPGGGTARPAAGGAEAAATAAGVSP